MIGLPSSCSVSSLNVLLTCIKDNRIPTTKCVIYLLLLSPIPALFLSVCSETGWDEEVNDQPRGTDYKSLTMIEACLSNETSALPWFSPLLCAPSAHYSFIQPKIRIQIAVNVLPKSLRGTRVLYLWVTMRQCHYVPV